MCRVEKEKVVEFFLESFEVVRKEFNALNDVNKKRVIQLRRLGITLTESLNIVKKMNYLLSLENGDNNDRK